MRNPTFLLLALAPACSAQVGTHASHTSPDAGADSSTACTTVQVVSGDRTISGDTSASDLPDTCWKLAGKLSITGSAMTSLAKLGDLRAVGDLEIASTNLTSLDFTSPVDVTGHVHIHDNAQLADLSKLAPQAGVVMLDIENNAKLTAIALTSLTSISDSLVISNNAALTSLDLRALTSVGSMTLSNDPLLASIGTLTGLTAIAGSLTIDHDSALANLDAFASPLSAIAGNLVITNNAALTDLGNLGHTGRIAGAVMITNNGHLDYCAAGEVGCCVQASSWTLTNNMTSSCNSPNPPWCWNDSYGCPYSGAGY